MSHCATRIRLVLLLAGLLVSPRVAAAQSEHDHHQRADTDTAFASMQERGKAAMGVDQYSSAHQFEDLSDGGRIELQRDSSDHAGVTQIRAHLQRIAKAFAAGNFNVPGFVHAGEVPGTSVMRERRDRISYRFSPLLGGGQVRIATTDRAARRAVHEFLAFQRREHRVAEH
ncbi:MAG: hypothetical protein ACJ8CN_13665 [Gemmatimonadales bacterium]